MFLLGGVLSRVMVPAMAFCLTARSWFCHIHHVRSICAWWRKKACNEGQQRRATASRDAYWVAWRGEEISAWIAADGEVARGVDTCIESVAL